MGLEKGVSASEGDVFKLVLSNGLRNLLDGRGASCGYVPRLWIVASGASMLASSSIDAGAETWSIYSGRFHYFNQ